MGRSRIEIGAEAEERIVALLTRGVAASAIAAELGISAATAKRRIRELKGKVPAARAAALAAVTPPAETQAPADGGEEIEVPAGATLEQIDHWLEVAKKKANEAATLGDPDAHLSYMRMVIALLEARRKSAPIPKADPNENPDLVEAAARVRERWHRLADSLVRVAKSPVAESIARLLRPEEKAA